MGGWASGRCWVGSGATADWEALPTLPLVPFNPPAHRLAKSGALAIGGIAAVQVLRPQAVHRERRAAFGEWARARVWVGRGAGWGGARGEGGRAREPRQQQQQRQLTRECWSMRLSDSTWAPTACRGGGGREEGTGGAARDVGAAKRVRAGERARSPPLAAPLAAASPSRTSLARDSQSHTPPRRPGRWKPATRRPRLAPAPQMRRVRPSRRAGVLVQRGVESRAMEGGVFLRGGCSTRPPPPPPAQRMLPPPQLRHRTTSGWVAVE